VGTRRLGLSAALIAAASLAAVGCAEGHHLTLADLTGPSDSTATTVTTIRPSARNGVPTTSSRSTVASEATAPGATWTPVTANLAGMASECGNISLVSARPDRDQLIVSVSLHGLWASTGTADWTALGTGAGSAPISNRGSKIVYDPDHPDTFWESGIYNGGGVYRTDDGGQSFRQLGDVVHVDAVSVDLSDPQRQTLVAGLHEQTGLVRSSDGGRTWTKISTTLPPDAGFTTSPFVVDFHTYLVGTNHSDKAGVFRTTDGGAAWTQVFQGAVVGQPLLTTTGNLLWVVDGGGIIASHDAGATWTSAARSGTVDSAAPSLVELPGAMIAAVGSSTIVASPDGGASWQKVGPALPFRPLGMTYSPSRRAFYIWYFTCSPGGDNAVPANAIMGLDLAGS
jgi:photosystem II stability/assembly factor-like uncharacterized protein